MIPSIDFETYSEAGYVWTGAKWGALDGAPSGKNRYGLGCVGAAVYAEHPSTEVLSLAWSSGFWKPGDMNPETLFLHIESGGLLAAWNAPFEYWIWNKVCVPRYNWPPLPLRQLRCSMARARAWCLPPGLDAAGDALCAVPPPMGHVPMPPVAAFDDSDIPF